MKKLITIIVIIIIISSLGYLGPQNHDKFSHHSVMDKIEYHEGDQSAGNKNEMIDTSEFVKFHSLNPEIKDFFTQFRTSDIISFPCQNCHNLSLDQLKSANPNIAKAHWDITLQHAGPEIMNCTSCHQVNELKNLRSLSGENISFDRSYKLCGQCHSTQYKDWQGGAHGKNLSGWDSPRLVKTCVNCHDPHNPSIESRWPSRLVKKEN